MDKFGATFPDVEILTWDRWDGSRGVEVEGLLGRGRMTMKRWFERWRLPYGIWRCADGREVLFNRDYMPIWQRIDGVVTAANPRERVAFFEERCFCGDGRKTVAKKRRLESVLAAFKAGQDVSRYQDAARRMAKRREAEAAEATPAPDPCGGGATAA